MFALVWAATFLNSVGIGILNINEFAAGFAEFFELGGGFGFDVTANQRFGAAGAEGDPFVVREEKFVAVGADELLDGQAADRAVAFAEAGEEGLFFLGSDFEVEAVGMEFAGLFFEFL